MHFTVPNKLEEIYRVETQILEEIQKAGYDENSRFAIRLALDEALINAYKHGNRGNPNKSIYVDVVVNSREVEISVEDEGDGFDQSILLDPRRGDQLRRTSGRGVFLIRQFMSTTHFNEKGTRITFSYHKRQQFGQELKGMAHWKFETADVLELNPLRVENDPQVIYDCALELLNSGAKQIMIDLKFLDRIDSSILGFLVRATREAESRGCSLVLVRPQPEIDRVIRATSLDVVLRVYGDLRRAMTEMETASARTTSLPG